jgi:poly-beta-1,6-N-acetyl-D-glucosamine synthase
MACVFWAAFALLTYTYFGYPAWLWLRRLWRVQPVGRAPFFPSVSVVLVVRNEESYVESKLSSLFGINYPAEMVEIIAVSDGSTDATNLLLSKFAQDSGLRVLLQQQSCGKAAGLNWALQIAAGEIVVFTDARQTIANDAVLRLMENFADPSIGCASGELTLGDPVTGENVRGVGLYWKTEKFTRELESASGSVVGATGALYAVRRHLVQQFPPETILDDVFIPMQVARQGYRVVFDSRARIWDVPDLGTGREFARKVRTLGGIYQLLQRQPWLLTSDNPLRFEFISHKVLRLAVPFALCAALGSCLLFPAGFYRAALVLQLAFYGLSVWGSLKLRWSPVARIADAAFTFVFLNAAAAVAFANFVSGRRPAWGR